MLRRSGFFRNRKSRILLCVELLLLIIGIAGLFEKPGVVVGTEETTTLLEEGVSLPAGVYTARLYYDTGEDNVVSFGMSLADVRDKVLLYNTVPLYRGYSVGECRFYLLNHVDGLKVQINDEGVADFTIHGVEIVKGTDGSRIFIFCVILGSMVINSVVMLYLYNQKYPVATGKLAVIFGVPVLGLIASLPVMVDYNICGADLSFHLMRMEMLAEHICGGEFFTRIESGWLAAHGYANSVFFCDTFLLLPAMLQVIGFSINSAYRLFVICVNLATSGIAYLSFSKCFSNSKIGLLGCALYTLAPYRLYSIYNRSAVGEYTAMIFLPLLMWGFYRIYTMNPDEKGYLRNWVIPMIGFSGIIQSHVLSCEMVGVCVVLLCLILWKKTFRRNTFLVLAATVGMTVAVNAWFLVPFLDLMGSDRFYFGNNANVMIQNKGVFFAQLFYTLQAAGSSSQYTEYGMVEAEPIGIGAALLLCLLFWIYFLWKYRGSELTGQQKRERKTANIALLVGCIMLGMSTCYFPWDFLSSLGQVPATLVGTLQFPTRLTGMATACMVFVSCVMGLQMLREKWDFISGKTVLIGVAVVSLVFGTFQVNDILLSKEGPLRLYSPKAIGHSAVLWAEYLPLGAELSHFYAHAPVAGEGVAITAYEKEGLQVQASLVVEKEADMDNCYIEFPLLYYKGYMAKVQETGGKLQVVKGDNSDVRVILPVGFQGTIEVSYDGMWYWHLAEAISVIGCVSVLVVLVRQRHSGKVREEKTR